VLCGVFPDDQHDTLKCFTDYIIRNTDRGADNYVSIDNVVDLKLTSVQTADDQILQSNAR
jgi:hypothetical protein